MSVRLTRQLKDLLDEHTKKLNLSRTELVRAAVRHFLVHLETGQVELAFLNEFEKKGADLAMIITAAIKGYVVETAQVKEGIRIENEGIRIENEAQSEAEKRIINLEGL